MTDDYTAPMRQAHMTTEEYLNRIRIPCPICSYGYDPTLPAEVRIHAEFHADYLLWRRCSQPDSRLAAYGGDVRVDAASSEWLHHIVHGYAVGLTFDPGIAEPQWNPDRPADMADNERDLHALVLVESGCIAAGAVAFGWIVWEDRAPGWCMRFASIDGEWRRKGVMTRRWSRWRETYGDFTLEEPRSCAMKAFVAKMDATPDGALLTATES